MTPGTPGSGGSDAGPLSRSAVVGIDVVDLRSARVLAGLPRPRTVNRVLSADERGALARTDDPSGLFWVYWSAKEAAFKAATLLRGAPPIFAHAAFVVDPEAEVVRYGDWALPLKLHGTPERLVAVVQCETGGEPGPVVWAAAERSALHGGFGEAPLPRLLERFSHAERDAVRGLPSALARLAARTEAATLLGVSEDRLAVICPPGPSGRRPPYLWVDGVPRADLGLSISHDGDWVAWAVAGRSQGSRGR